MPSASQPESVRHDTLDAAHGVQENFPSVSGYEFSASTQPTASYTYPDPNSQMQNLSTFSSLMVIYCSQSFALTSITIELYMHILFLNLLLFTLRIFVDILN